MKQMISVLLAALLILGTLCGCARDMSGESRTTAAPAATSTAGAAATVRPSAGASSSPAPTDSTADGVIDAGKDAVDGVVGAGKEAVDDIVDAGEDLIDDVTGNKPTATPKATKKP